MGYTIDITDRKHAEEALRAGEERYRDLLESLPVGVYRKVPGSEGSFLFANSFLARMFGYGSAEELLRTSLRDLCEDPADLRALSERILHGGSVQGDELRFRRKDGTAIWGSVTAHAVRDERGDLAHIDGFVEDITDRKRAEGQKALLEAQLGQAQRWSPWGGWRGASPTISTTCSR
jgi:PAS domain S-box-containing protein